MIKKIVSLLFICSIISLNAFALPSPTAEFYINDFADIIDSNTEKHILNMSVLIEKETGAQLVVVTVDDLEGMEDSQYALELGRKWGIGNEDKNNGFLMLLAPRTSNRDGSLRFEVGYGLEGALPDGKCGRIQDEYMIPHLSGDTLTEKNYSAAVLSGYDQIVAEVCVEYGIDIPKEVDATPMEEESSDDVETIIILIVFLAIIIIQLKAPPSSRGSRFIFFGGHRGGGRFSGGSGSFGGFSGGGGSFGGGGSSRKF